jgi:hypothetical protein
MRKGAPVAVVALPVESGAAAIDRPDAKEAMEGSAMAKPADRKNWRRCVVLPRRSEAGFPAFILWGLV